MKVINYLEVMEIYTLVVSNTLNNYLRSLFFKTAILVDFKFSSLSSICWSWIIYTEKYHGVIKKIILILNDNLPLFFRKWWKPTSSLALHLYKIVCVAYKICEIFTFYFSGICLKLHNSSRDIVTLTVMQLYFKGRALFFIGHTGQVPRARWSLRSPSSCQINNRRLILP